MPNIDPILATIEQSNLVADDVLDELRQRLEKSKVPVDLKLAVKWLVQKEHITSDQGRRLLARGNGASGGATGAATSGKRPTSGPVRATDSIGLAPLDDDGPPPADVGRGQAADETLMGDDDDLEIIDAPPTSPRSGRRAEPEADDEVELFPLDEDAGTARGGQRAAPTSPERSEPKGRRPSGEKGGARWAGSPKVRRREPQPPPPDDGGTGAEDLYGDMAEAGRLGGAAYDEGAYEGGDYDAGASQLQGRPAPRAKLKSGGGGASWDSPLLLVTGGTVLLLLIVGGFLYWRVGRLTGDEAFKQAKDLWAAGSYTNAIDRFDKYLAGFPEHINVSEARVLRGVARLRQAVEGARDWTKTLATAKEVIEEIRGEEKFSEGRKELASLLPQIAEGLSKQAADHPSTELIEQSHEALALVNKYVGKEQRPTQKLLEIQASLDLTKHHLGQTTALEKAVAGIKQAIDAGTPQEAYKIRKDLLKEYPGVAGDETLQEAVLSLSRAEQNLVTYVSQPRPAEPADAPSPVEAEVVMADRRGPNAPGVANQIVYVLAGGAAYALEADTGKVIWRRFVGHDTTFVPRPLTRDSAGDVLLVDSERHELLRVDGRSGTVRWRQSVGEPFDAHPTMTSKQAWVATRSGKLVSIDLDDGQSPGHISLPQELRVGPAFDSRGQYCYQLGKTSNLFALSTKTNQCQEVLYLGHDAESIHVPPLVVAPYVFIAEDHGANGSLLLVLATDENGAALHQAQEPVPLVGRVMAPLASSGRTLVIATDRGAIYTYEINPPDPGPPLTVVAEKPADKRPAAVRYPLLVDSQLLIAGHGTTKYDIQSSRGRLEPKWVKDDTDVQLQPPALLGNVVYQVRQKAGQPDVLVGALNTQDGDRFWETRLAAPPAGAPVKDARSGRVRLFNRLGGLFDMPSDSFEGRRVENAAALPDEPASAFPEPTNMTVLSSGGLALSSASQDKRALIASNDASPALRWMPLPDPLGAPAIGFEGGLLLPGQLGQVFVLDPATGRHVVRPFQPRLVPGEEPRWTMPVPLGEHEVLLADGHSRLYRLGVGQKPEPHLVTLAEAGLPGPVVVPPAALAKTVYAVNGSAELMAFELPNLIVGKSWPLSTGLAWGPFAAGERVLVATVGGELLAFDDQQTLVWQVPWQHGHLAGAPLATDDGLLLSTMTGQIYRLDAASGNELASVDVGEPLAAGPVAFGERLLLAGYGGTLMVVGSF